MTTTTTTIHTASKVRWLTLAGTMITQFALGSVYTWSLFNQPLSQKLSAPISKIALSFGILSLALAIASSMAGKFQEKFGVKRVTLGAGVLLAIGFSLTSVASSLWMLYLSAGVIVGLAAGAGYLMTLSNCVKWFPERKGVISACAIGAYGLGGLGFKFICSDLLASQGLQHTFLIWGLIAMVMVAIGASLMQDAPQRKVSADTLTAKDFTLAEAVRHPQYWMLALMFLTACMSGLYVIGVAKDIGQNLVHLSALSAASAVTTIAVASLSGRLVLGVLSDKLARIRVISVGQVLSLLGIGLMMFTHLNEATFFLSVACVAFSFGGTITVFPSLVSDFFGLNNLTKNYGLIYLCYGIGSMLGSLVATLFGGFMVTFALIMTLLALSLVLSLTIRQPQAEFSAEQIALDN